MLTPDVDRSVVVAQVMTTLFSHLSTLIFEPFHMINFQFIHQSPKINSRPIIEDITEAESNFDIDDFIVNPEPASHNSDHEVVQMNDSEVLS